MGSAAYRRGSMVIARDAADAVRAAARTNDARAVLLRDALEAGCTITYNTSRGVIVAGPVQTAVGDPIFGVRRYDRRWGLDETTRTPWAAAVRLVEVVGRRAPTAVTCPVGRISRG